MTEKKEHEEGSEEPYDYGALFYKVGIFAVAILVVSSLLYYLFAKR